MIRHRLYFKIYLAVLASIVIFALATAFMWRMLDDREERVGGRFNTLNQLISNALPSAQMPAAEQQTALEKLLQNTTIGAQIIDRQGKTIAQVGDFNLLPPILDGHAPPEFKIKLEGERTAIVRPRNRPEALGNNLNRARNNEQPSMGFAFFSGLLILFGAVALTALPLTRRLTRRLESLNSSVELWGQGDLSARVPVQGNDEIAKLASNFNQSAQKIETLVNTNKMMLANASHELRTPLTRIRMNVELLNLNESRRKQDIEQDINELDEMIEGILLSSRLDGQSREQTDMTLDQVDVLALVAEECAHYQTDAFEINVEGASVNAQVNTKLIKRLVRNVIENAIKYGASPMTIRVNAAQPQVQIDFIDSGQGVNIANPDELFEPFVRAAQPAQSTHKGVGLGLSLVRKIAQRHGGAARIVSSVNQGLHLVVTL